MPKLFMPPETFDAGEKDLIPEIQKSNMELIKRHLKESSVYIVGNYDEKFWSEIVLSKPKDYIFNPVDGFPILLFEKLTHFGVITLDEAKGREFYFGNSDLTLADFTRALLIKTEKLYEQYKIS